MCLLHAVLLLPLPSADVAQCLPHRHGAPHSLLIQELLHSRSGVTMSPCAWDLLACHLELDRTVSTKTCVLLEPVHVTLLENRVLAEMIELR